MNRALRLAATLAVLGAWLGCSEAPPPQQAGLWISVDRVLLASGQPATVSVRALTEHGSRGQGDVLFSSTAGSLSGGQTASLQPDGTTSVSFVCDRATDARCAGAVQLEAVWSSPLGTQLTAVAQVTIAVPAPPDAGPPDAGPPDAGPSDAGYALTLTSDRDVAYPYEFVTLTAQLQLNGQPVAGSPLSFETTAGWLASDGGYLTGPIATDSTGFARALFGGPPLQPQSSPCAASMG